MKVYKRGEEVKDFLPVQLTIVFESEQDLTNLWYRLNYSIYQAQQHVIDQSQRCILLDDINDSSHDLWDVIDDIVKARSIPITAP